MMPKPQDIARCILRELRDSDVAIRYAERISKFSTKPEMKKAYSEAANIIRTEQGKNDHGSASSSPE